MNVGHNWTIGSEPPPYGEARVGYRGLLDDAVIVSTPSVEGAPLSLYAMSGGRHPWPALADVLRLLNGASYPIIEAGAGLDTLRGPAGQVEVVSPQATAAAVRLALREGRITAERAEAILGAVEA